MVATATVLMWVSKLIPAPWLQGGSVTLASMVPIVSVSLMLGTKWGLLCSVLYAFIQMLFGFYPPPTQSFINYVLVVVLDYIAAFGVLGFAGGIYRALGKKRYAIALSGFLVTVMRYVCHILSGILIWGVYADEGQSVLSYSLLYNGGYMVPEIIITTVALALVAPFIEKNVQ